MKKMFIAAFLSMALSGFAFAGEEIQLAGSSFTEVGMRGSDAPAELMVVAAVGDGMMNGASSNTVGNTQPSPVSGPEMLSASILVGTGLVTAVVIDAFASSGGTSTSTHH